MISLRLLNSGNIFCRHKNIDEEDKNMILNGLKRIKGRKHQNIDVSALYSDNNMLTRIIKELSSIVDDKAKLEKKLIINDIKTAYKFLVDQLGFCPTKIITYGYSIGSGPSVALVFF